MTNRKHFIQIAETVAKIENGAVRYQTALEFAYIFRKENLRFDTFRFMAACNASPCQGEPIVAKLA
jgi:hypothetical protein